MRILGLDFGAVTIGVAVSDPEGSVATGLTTLRRNASESLRPNLKELKQIIREYAITTIVIGFPKNMDNTVSERGQLTQAFKEKLERYFKNLPVVLWDERLSTQAVSRVFEGSRSRYETYVDEMAAVYILQGYLDYSKQKNDSYSGRMSSGRMIK